MLLINEIPVSSKILKDVQVLVVDNDLDNRDLYQILLEDYGAKVTASSSIQEALSCLDEYIPTLLICEFRFLGESVLPLIQRVRSLSGNSGKAIPTLIISTYEPTILAQQLPVTVEAWLLKPIDINDFIIKVWGLSL